MGDIRRKDREIPREEAEEILATGEYGVLSTLGKDGLPYGIPLSYASQNGSIYFHCAVTGRKLDNLEACPNVSFCVVGRTKLLPEHFATEYESVVASGQVSEITGDEKYHALLLLVEKYSPEFMTQGKNYIEQRYQATRCFRIAIQSLSGKARR